MLPRLCVQTYANGAVNKALLKNPVKVCNSLIYVTDSVLLPSAKWQNIPVPTIGGVLALLAVSGK